MKTKVRLPLGTLVAALIAVYLAVSLVQIVRRNYQLKQELALLEQQIQTLEAEKTELSYKMQYYRTEAFQEKEARAKLGLQAPGEEIIILPQPAPPPPPANSSAPDTSSRSNWQQWMSFLFG